MNKIRFHCNKKIFLACIASISCLLIMGCGILLFQLRQFLPLIPVAPTLLGFTGKQTYLILFQNNAELRPGGGFIGSYAIASIDHGKITSFVVQNVYDADGLLTKHVEPYYIGRRYLQVHLYLHDSNFDVDFAKDAQIAASLLQLDTGQKVDGVLAIDLSFVRSLIRVIAPIYVPEYKDTIDANNFFILTETHADRYSFNGSTQKQDYLRALANAIRMKFEEKKLVYIFTSIPKVLEAIPQKHLLFASEKPDIQKILTTNRFSSTLTDTRKNSSGVINDFFGLNEANISINKANYYLTRSIHHTAVIDASGTITEHVTITYTNTSQHQAWPTGVYKAYVRFILPLHTKLLTIAIDNQQQHLVPAVTDYRIYEAPNFNPPSGLEVDHFQEAGKTLYGFIVSVGLITTKIVTITYQLPQSMRVSSFPIQYNLYLFKQPGMNNDPYTFTLTYPSTVTTNTSGTVPLVKKTSSQLIFSTPFSTDQDINVEMQM